MTHMNIKDRTIALVFRGSHAYGMATEQSDIDFGGIAIAPLDHYLGYFYKFEQFEGDFPFSKSQLKTIENFIQRPIGPDEKLDGTVYDIKKFFKLAGDCNPNIIEFLFADDDAIIYSTPVFEKLKENRDLFLSQKANFTFRGYAISQLKRINTHRSWLLNPLEDKPQRKDFGLPDNSTIPRDQLQAAESLIEKKVNEWKFSYNLDELAESDLLDEVRSNVIEIIKDCWKGLASIKNVSCPVDDDFDDSILSKSAGQFLGYDTNFLDILDKERRYRGALKNYNSYQNWKRNRNKKRAKMEADFGFDGKHASHLYRLLNMAEEILKYGKVIVKRPDKDEIMNIRNGGWTYDQLINWANQKEEIIKSIYDNKESPLPKVVNGKKLNELCVELINEFCQS
jgi:predicted nucleotidyltransferase